MLWCRAAVLLFVWLLVMAGGLLFKRFILGAKGWEQVPLIDWYKAFGNLEAVSPFSMQNVGLSALLCRMGVIWCVERVPANWLNMYVTLRSELHSFMCMYVVVFVNRGNHPLEQILMKKMMKRMITCYPCNIILNLKPFCNDFSCRHTCSGFAYLS